MSEAVLEKKIEMLDRFIGKTLADKYRIESGWRKSGLGKVYHAKHLLMDKPVAVKVLSPALAVDVNIVNRFSAEARTVSSLSHPNILNVTDFGTDADGTVFIVMEDADGKTIRESLEKEGVFSVERAVKIARQIASALSAAHAKKIIHKHLNNKSILLAENASGTETVKVLDFGSLRPEDDQMFAEELSKNDLEYVAPEQVSETFEPDERSDIYSVGVILYEMLTGEVPFTAETGEEILKKQSENPPLPFSAFRDDLPEQLEPVVLRALANNPEMRYQNVNALIEDLGQFSKESEISDLTVVPKPNADAKNNMWKTAFVVLSGISLLAVGMIYATYTKQTDPQTFLQSDVNGLPVQPLNPATGINEQNLLYTSSDGTMPEIIGNSSVPMTDPVPGGDGFDPWARGGLPPSGAPTYPGGGQVITIPGDGSGSQFMPGLDSSGGIILIPVPVNSNTSVKPTPTPKDGKVPPANTQVTTDPKETPTGTTPEVKPTPATKPEVKPTPAAKPTVKPDPKQNPPSTSDKGAQSGKTQDTN